MLCVALTGAASGTPASFAIPFFELEELRLSGALAVGRFASLTDQRSLYAVRLADGHVVTRIDDVGRAAFDVHGNRLVYADGARRQIVDVDLVSARRSDLWTIPAGNRVSAVHVFGDAILVMMFDAENRRVSWLRDTEGWHPVEISHSLQPLALAGEHIVAVDSTMPSRLVARPLDGSGDWKPLYQFDSGRVPDAVRSTGDGRAVEFLQRHASPVALVRVSLDGAMSVAPIPSDSPRRGGGPNGWSDDYVAWIERRDGRVFLTSLERGRRPPAVAIASTAASDSVLPGDAMSSADRAVQWLERQLAAPFTSNRAASARLIDSYEDTTRAGWIYDAALAAIAFTATGRPALASELLAGLEHLQRDDGSWISSFDPDTAMPRGSDRYVGAMAWGVMSANYYEWLTGDRRFAAMARRGLGYLERFRVTDAQSELRGAFRMGPTRPTAISIEHTMDAYSAFLWRGRLDDSRRDVTIADEAREFVLGQMWREPRAVSPPDGYFRVGVGTGGVYLDAQTWTALALNGSVADPRLAEAVATAERVLRVDGARHGSITNIVGFDESDEASRRKVWAEGTEGMVAALLALGETRRAMDYHRQTGRYQAASGGIPYATDNAEGWSTAPSVAATAWYVLNSAVPARNPFNPGAHPRPVLPAKGR